MDTGTTMMTESSRETVCLFVFSPSKQERRYQMQREKLSDRLHTLDEHHVKIAEIFEDQEGHIGEEEVSTYSAEELRRQFHINPGQFKVVLVSDSSVRMCAESCISCEEVIMRVENQPAEPKHSFI
jgi:hypothetical protein